jgi:outer membrane protein
MRRIPLTIVLLLTMTLTLALAAQAQSSPMPAGQASAPAALPNAPAPALKIAVEEAQNMPPGTPGNAASSGSQPLRLTRAEAEQVAIRNNPRIHVSQLLALAQHQVVREARSAELPTAYSSVSAVDAENGSRISAGSLTASRLITHAGAGGTLTQLITDFGHVRNLVLSQKLEEKAQNANALATKEEIVLATDQAFYNALTAQAVLDVAKQTVATRQTTQTLISQMTANKLKSTLDLSFANVDLSQAQLLQLDAVNNAEASMATLDAVLGLDHSVQYELVDDTTPLAAPAPEPDQLIQTALAQRPDLQSLTFGEQSAQKFARAQWDQLLPSITAGGIAGVAPVRTDQYYITNWWGGIGVNLNIPIFNGFLYTAQAKEAAYRAQADSERTRDLRDQIVCDVRTAWLNANTAYQRVGVTEQLVKEADMSLQLAQTRYRLGLSSIVELSQAELQQTSAHIDNTNAQYQYRLSLAALNYQIGANP